MRAEQGTTSNQRCHNRHAMRRLRREELLYGDWQLLRPSTAGGPAASCIGLEPVTTGGIERLLPQRGPSKGCCEVDMWRLRWLLRRRAMTQSTAAGDVAVVGGEGLCKGGLGRPQNLEDAVRACP